MALLKGHVQTWTKSSGQPLLENEITGVRGNLHREVCLLKRVHENLGDIWCRVWSYRYTVKELLVSSLGGQLVLRDPMSSDDELDRVIQVTRFNSFIFLSYGRVRENHTCRWLNWILSFSLSILFTESSVIGCLKQ